MSAPASPAPPWNVSRASSVRKVGKLYTSVPTTATSTIVPLISVIAHAYFRPSRTRGRS